MDHSTPDTVTSALFYVAYTEEMTPYQGDDILLLSVDGREVRLTVERFASDEGIITCKLKNGLTLLLPKSTWLHLIGRRTFKIDDRSDKEIVYSEGRMPMEGDLLLSNSVNGVRYYVKVLQDVLHPSQRALVQGEERQVHLWTGYKGLRRS